MSMQVPGRPVETDISTLPEEAPIDPGDRLSIRQHFTTRFAKIVFLASFFAVTAGAAIWTAQQALPTQFGLVMGTVVGYMAMGVFAAAVVATIVTALVVGLPRLVTTFRRLTSAPS